MDDTAKRIRDAAIKPVEDAINEQVDPAVQFQVEEALGTIADADPRLHGMQQVDHVSATVEAALEDAVRSGAVEHLALVEAVKRAVLTHPRVQEAMKAVGTIAAEVASAEIERLRTKK
jgi:hypothetical protein